MQRIVSIAVLALCTACPKPAPVATPESTAPPPSPAPAAVVAAPSISADGVGGLTADSAVDEASLTAGFPGFEIKTSTRSSEGETMTVFELHRDGALSLTVEPNSAGKVYRVTIVDPQSKSPAGIAVGATYAQMSEALPAHECFRLVEERSDSLACYGKELSSIGYVFGDAAKGQKLGVIPSKKALAPAAVTEILWLPESE